MNNKELSKINAVLKQAIVNVIVPEENQDIMYQYVSFLDGVSDVCFALGIYTEDDIKSMMKSEYDELKKKNEP